MHILLTALAAIAFIGCLLAYTRSQREADKAARMHDLVHQRALKLQEALARITAAEREIDTLRRELRKLSGKFYAAERERESAAEFAAQVEYVEGEAVPLNTPTFCANYGQAQIEGPRSKAAACECEYCVEMRARRDLFRSSAVPKTVRGQAELARVNAGKP